MFVITNTCYNHKPLVRAAPDCPTDLPDVCVDTWATSETDGHRLIGAHLKRISLKRVL